MNKITNRDVVFYRRAPVDNHMHRIRLNNRAFHHQATHADVYRSFNKYRRMNNYNFYFSFEFFVTLVQQNFISLYFSLAVL